MKNAMLKNKKNIEKKGPNKMANEFKHDLNIVRQQNKIVQNRNCKELVCYTCVHAPYAPACNNCLFDSNYIKKIEK